MSQRILFIARELTEGGAAFLAIRHLERVAQTGRQIDFLVTGPVSQALVAQLGGITIHTVNPETHLELSGVLTPLSTCVDTYPCLTRQYDVVVGSSLFPDRNACMAFCASRAQRKLLVLLDEGLIIPGLSTEIKAAMQCAIVAADHLVPVSQGLLDKLAKHYRVLNEIPRTIIFPPINAREDAAVSPLVDSPLADLVDERPFHVVTAARLDQIKQISACLRAHWELRREGVDFHWHILGEGPEREALERELAQLDMADRFHLEGFHTKPRTWMKYADLFVLTSRSEGCPTVIREALAEGTPVMATDVNGVRELIEDGVTGIVLTDCETDLKDNLRRLITNRGVLERLRQNIARLPTKPDGYETGQLIELFTGEPRARPSPQVTILIPTFNHGERIRCAIESALMQDYVALEVVVCDDASTDQTASVVRQYLHDPRLSYVQRPSNIGRVANYRGAIETHARGDWVLMLDGDDYLTDPGFISQAMAILKSHQAANPLFLQAGHRVTWSATNDVPVDILPEIDTESALLTGQEYLSLVFKTGFFTHLGTLYCRAAALEQGFYTSNISSADMDSLLRLATRGNVIVMNKIAGVWLQHGQNASSNVPLGRIKENVQIFRQITKEGARDNTISLDELENDLTDYEARTLQHLFAMTIGKSATSPIDALRMLLIMLQINPRVCRNRDLMLAWQSWAKHLTRSLAVRAVHKIKRIVKRVS